ncbi:MAG: High-affinity branched-chain amino acid transport ATP-binding protein LivF [Candidatus Erwinia impunctatus]|nr:High-affinity branched-chain amino acid transport ATP-binding protein LivF [Culicoides impunctatus]
MLSLRAVNQFYGEEHILWDVDLDLIPGSCTGVLGLPGMGKTTLVNCIMGNLPIDSGSITWQEKNLPPRNLLLQPGVQRATMGISYVPQGGRLFSQLSVEENLQIALLAAQRAKEHPPLSGVNYEWFPDLHHLRHRRGYELSWEEQQQLALAIAVVSQPKLLILDQPTEGSSLSWQEKMCDILSQLNREVGMTILLLERQIPFIRNVADYFCVLHSGRNVAQGKMVSLNEQMISRWLTSSSSP